MDHFVHYWMLLLFDRFPIVVGQANTHERSRAVRSRRYQSESDMCNERKAAGLFNWSCIRIDMPSHVVAYLHAMTVHMCSKSYPAPLPRRRMAVECSMPADDTRGQGHVGAPSNSCLCANITLADSYLLPVPGGHLSSCLAASKFLTSGLLNEREA